ncbi:MAG TPA: glycosyltransferase family 39 protein [Aggregatilineales bacterium]|nr:glycosyltransferase family 39 protein [Aggregatilineales bacterium]
MTANSRRNAALIIPLLLVLIWLGLHWPQGSLWYDEGLTAWIVSGPWSRILSWCTQVDIQVPLHYVILKLWGVAAGNSEFALHAFSALCGLIAVAGIVAIARQAGGVGAGAAAGLLLGFSAGFVWIAYEVRAYAFALGLYSLATLFLFRLIEGRPSRFRRAGYALLMLALLYTHYTAMAGLAAHLVIAVWAAWRRAPPRTSFRLLRTLAVPYGLALLGFVPWLPILLSRGATDRSYYPGSVLPDRALATILSFKWLARDDVPIQAIVIGGLVVFLAAIPLASRRRTRMVAYGLFLAVLPIALTAAVVYLRAKLAGRYLWPAWIGIDLLIALGISTLTRRAILTGAIALALVGAPWLTGQIGHPPDSDFRAAFAYIRNYRRPDDLLILRDGTLFSVASYYGFTGCETGDGCIGLPASPITDVTHILHADEAVPILKAQDAAIRGVWVLSWQGDVMEPENVIAGLLETIGHEQAISAGFGDVSLQYFRLDASLNTLQGPTFAASPLVLLPGGMRIDSAALIASSPSLPGDALIAEVWWWRDAGPIMPQINDLRVSIRLVDEKGTTIGQIDQPPSGFFYYPDHWPTRALILGRYKMLVPRDAAPGTITFQLKIYGAADGLQRDLEVGTVRIANP